MFVELDGFVVVNKSSQQYVIQMHDRFCCLTKPQVRQCKFSKHLKGTDGIHI